MDTLLAEHHKRYLTRCCLGTLKATDADANRLAMLYYSVCGLAVLDALDHLADDRDNLVEWIYALLIKPTTDCDRSLFRGSLSNGAAYAAGGSPRAHPFDFGSVPITYMALATLLTLGDDLSRLDRAALCRGVRGCARADGSYSVTDGGGEHDLRVTYCAAAICFMLDDLGEIDADATAAFILRCRAYDGAFGQAPCGQEGHGGTTFTAMASLAMLGRLTSSLTEVARNRLGRWCIMRQVTGGFQGRPAKLEDSCYSFWVGATLCMLGLFNKIDIARNRSFLLSVQDDAVGGFGKDAECRPDPLHTFLSLCALSLVECSPSGTGGGSGGGGVQPIDPLLLLTHRSRDHLTRLQKQWRLDTGK